jgi:hypothetical protein
MTSLSIVLPALLLPLSQTICSKAFAEIPSACARDLTSYNTIESTTKSRIQSDSTKAPPPRRPKAIPAVQPSTSSPAQPRPPASTDPTPPPAPAAEPIPTDGLDPRPTDFAAIGASLRLPVGSSVVRLAQEEFPAWEVLSPAGQPEWRLRVEQVWSNDPMTDCPAQVKAGMQGLAAGGTQVKMLSERAGTVSGCESRTAWASLTNGAESRIAGLVVVRTGDGIFVSVATSTAAERFADVEATLDRSFATLRVVDPRTVQAEREAALARGETFLKSLTRERLRALADGVSRVRRLWRPGADGEPEEIGWVEVLARTAPRSAAGRAGPALMNRASDKEEGLLITLIARTTSADGTDRVETRASYWVAWDLQAEAWSVRSEQKGAGPKTRFEQIGLMSRPDGATPPTLMVATDAGAGMADPATWSRPPVAYLPQALALALGPTLPQDGSAPGDLAFYALDPASGRLCQRLAQWTRDEAAGPAWRLEVRNTPDSAASREWFDARGQLLRRREADGSCMDPSSPAEIERRWKAIGLEP